mmetsp:Transcript_11756/g.43644  ORF Transcript_11756/g.43644 Transcript_11756/m.43644 type:complete len:216 (+) Transcript_11756:879-1526(+)
MPDIPTENFSASPSKRHVPGDRVIGRNAPTPTHSKTPPSRSSTATGHKMRRPLAPHSGGIHVPLSRPISSVSFHRVPINALPALPVRPKRFVTALPWFRDLRTFATTKIMKLHWKTARAHFSLGAFCHHFALSLPGSNPGSLYVTAESSNNSSELPKERGIPRLFACRSFFDWSPKKPPEKGLFARRESLEDKVTASSEMALSRSKSWKYPKPVP